MKNFLNIIFVLLTVLLINVPVFADIVPTDPPPCPGDGCNIDDWQMYDYDISGIPQCPDCIIHVWVKANLPCKEMYLQSYQFMNMACTDCFINNLWTWADVNREIIKAILVAGPLSPGYPTGSTVIKVSEEACWKPGESLTNPMEFQPCGSSTCCKRTYIITKTDINSTPTYSFVSGEILGPPCVSPCFPVCSIETWFPTIIILENKDNNNDIGIITSSVIPNPNTGQAIIKYKCPETGNVEFILSDANGNIILKLNNIKTSVEDNLQLDLRKLSSGNYFYQLNINNKSISTGSIKIEK